MVAAVVGADHADNHVATEVGDVLADNEIVMKAVGASRECMEEVTPENLATRLSWMKGLSSQTGLKA